MSKHISCVRQIASLLHVCEQVNCSLFLPSLFSILFSSFAAVKNPTKYLGDNFRSLICCFPGNRILTNMFKYQSMNSSLSLKIAPNGGGGSRFLVFVICLVADLTHCRYICGIECICKYQLTAADGGNDGGGGGYEKPRSESEISLFLSPEPEKYKDYHVFILSTADMV
ncbi:hypothetical protein V6Z11_D10G286200 [Gossypium hirsutum]